MSDYDDYKTSLTDAQRSAIAGLSVDNQDLLEAAYYLNEAIGYIAADQFKGAWTMTLKEPGVQQVHVTNNGVVSHESNIAVGNASGNRDSACSTLVKCATQMISALENATQLYNSTDSANAEDIDLKYGAPDIGTPNSTTQW